MKKLMLMFAFVLFFSTANTTEAYFVGVVKYYNQQKGFGYIKDKTTKRELFVYEENLIDEISGGALVRYRIRDTRKGLEAYDVRL